MIGLLASAKHGTRERIMKSRATVYKRGNGELKGIQKLAARYSPDSLTESNDSVFDRNSFGVMAGLDPAIHALPHGTKNVDARVKPGHDEFVARTSPTTSSKREATT